MTIKLSNEDADKALRGISIPPRPAVLNQLMQEVRRDAPNVRAIANLVSSDVALAAAILKTVNSPFFGLRNKIGSVQQAISLLGIRNLTTLATGILLRSAVGGDAVSMERFWESAEKVAGITAYIASRLPGVPRDDAYTFGLFHDCGMPVLMQKFPDYKSTLKLANASTGREMTTIEDELHATNHAVVGYMLARAWYLPDTISEAILRHHDPAVFERNDDTSNTARTLIAAVYLAEQFYDQVLQMRDNPHWARMGGRVLAHLGIDDIEYGDLQEEILVINGKQACEL
ncbi:MAG: HDOD domain-containing protein [Zoogloea sp.]|nr:HDOD domain-containing protein [Zoogloea sp.]